MPKHKAQNNKHSSHKNHELHKTERVSTGITGLDKLMQGGYIPNDVYLVTGGTGTGKTIFCSQFLWDGLKKGENCIFFSLEEKPYDVLYDAIDLGMDFKPYIEKKKFLIEYQDPFEMADITTLVKEKIKKMNAKRVVIDSTSIFGMVFQNEHELRNRLYELIKALKEVDIDIVALLTAEIPEDSKALSRFGVEEFVVDGVILLNYMGIGGEIDRSIIIRKMRRTNHYKDVVPFEISKTGIVVKKPSMI
jgi:KaiC/GvpD/RAD55 family RecA-like ATPase